MAGKSNYLRNRLLDWLYRGQSYAPPLTTYIALFKGVPGDGGVEVAGPVGSTGYQRFAIASTLNAWAGTQGGGSNQVSSGTTGRISNIITIQYAIPLTNWAPSATPLTHFAIMDAETAGNMMHIGQIAIPKVVMTGDPQLSFPAGTLAIYEV